MFHAVPDDLVTTWKQYKDFILHHERLNKPVRAHRLRGLFCIHSLALQAKDTNGEAVGRVPSEAGDEQAPEPHKSTENFEQILIDEKVRLEHDCGKEKVDRRPSTTNMAGDKEKEKGGKKSIRPDQEPFETWEREEMEKLLGELRGHLGETFSIFVTHMHDHLADVSISCIPNAILGRRGHRKQFPLQRRQALAATDLQLGFSRVYSLSFVRARCMDSQEFTHSDTPPPSPSSRNFLVSFSHILVYDTKCYFYM